MPKKKLVVVEAPTATEEAEGSPPSIDEIIKLVDDKEKSAAIIGLRQQMQDDFDKCFCLEPYAAKKGFQSYTSPAPLAAFRKIQFSVDNAELSWRIAMPDNAPDKAKEAASNAELALTGFLAMINRRLLKRGEPSIGDSVTWFGGARGTVAGKALVYDDNNGEQQIMGEAVDPMLVTWERGGDGLVWWAQKYPISKADVKARWGIKLEGDDDSNGQIGAVIDFFDIEYNAVVLESGSVTDGKRFLKKPERHGLDHVPCFIRFSGSMPTVFNNNNNTPTLKYQATSVWNGSRGVYNHLNKQTSFLMDVVERYIAGTLIHESEDGKKKLVGVPWEAFTVIPVKKDVEKVYPLQPPGAPPETAALMTILNQDLSRTEPPYPSSYGIQQGAPSGELIKTLNEQSKSNYGPFTGVKAEFFQWLFEELLSQLRIKGSGAIKLRGMTKEKKFFAIDFNPDDIDPDWYLIVTVEPKTPRDEAQALQAALAATQPRPPSGRPLLPDSWVWENILLIQNPLGISDQIDRQLLNDKIRALPDVQFKYLALEFLRKGDQENARKYAALAELATAKMMSDMAGGGAPSNGQGGGAAPAGNAAVAPQGAPPSGPQSGIPPQVAQALMEVSQVLGIPPEQVAQMPTQEVEARLRAKEGV